MALTQEDRQRIRDLARSTTSQQTQKNSVQPKQGFFRTLGQEIVEPFAKIAATGEKGLSQLLYGNAAKADFDYSKNVLGRKVEPAKNPIEFTGAVIEAGSNFIPVGAAEKAAATVAKAGIKTVGLKSLLNAAGKSAALTGLASGIGATGAALQEPDMTAGQVAGRTATGAALGAGVGFVAPLAGRAIQKVAASRGNKVAQEAEQAIASQSSKVNKLNIKTKLQERLPQNTSLRNKVRQNTGVDIEDIIIEEGVPFTKKGDNLFDFSEAIEDVIPARKQGLGNALDSLLGTVQKKGDLDAIQREAIRNVKNAPKGTYKLREDEIISKIKSIIAREKQAYGNSPSYSVLNKIKSAGYDKWDGASAEARAGQALSKTIKDIIEKEFSDGSTQSNAIREVNRRYGNLINLENFLKRTDSRPVRGGKLGKSFNQLIGAVSGSQGGILGSILGSEIAGRITDAVVDPTRISDDIVKLMQKEGILPASIQAVNEARDYVLQNQADLVRQLIKPSVRALPVGVPQPIQLPSEGILEGQAKLRKNYP